LVQGEPTDEDAIIQVDDMQFAVDGLYSEIIDSFDVEYSNGVFRKGFAVYPNGRRSSC